jgi:short-subunit dehydrogenase
MNLRGKTAIVTGASTGIGKATAKALADQGALVFLLARSEDKLLQVKKEIRERNGQAHIIIVDLSNITSINNCIEKIKEKTKQIDIILNVAGIWHGNDKAYAGINYEYFDQTIIIDTLTVGITAPMLLVHGLLNLMPQNSDIINISGTFENGAKGWLPYYVSKKAIEEFTVGLAQELEEKEIYVNCISPSDTSTEAYQKYFPEYIEDAVTPEEVAEEALSFILKNKNKVSGSIKVVKK